MCCAVAGAVWPGSCLAKPHPLPVRCNHCLCPWRAALPARYTAPLSLLTLEQHSCHFRQCTSAAEWLREGELNRRKALWLLAHSWIACAIYNSAGLTRDVQVKSQLFPERYLLDPLYCLFDEGVSSHRGAAPGAVKVKVKVKAFFQNQTGDSIARAMLVQLVQLGRPNPLEFESSNG